MASAAFTVNGSPPTGAVAVAASSTVNLALSSTSGVASVVWSVAGSHDSAATNPTITPAGSPSGATASFTMPVGVGQCYLIQCVVNGGVDADGAVDADATAKALVGVNAAWGEVPLCLNETMERSATHGWAEALNDALAALWTELSGECTIDTPAASIPVFTATTLTGTAADGVTGPTAVAVYDGVTLLGSADIDGTDWSYDWTPGAISAEGTHASLHAVASFASAPDATSDNVSTEVNIVNDFAALGVLRALWVPWRGVTLYGSDVAAWTDLVAGYVLAQGTPGAQPAYNATGHGTMPTFDYAGAEYLECDHADWDTFFGGDDTNCVMVLAHDCGGSDMCFAGLFGETTYERIMMTEKSALSTRKYWRAGADLDIAAPSTAFRHEVGENVGTTVKVFENGSQIATDTLDPGVITLKRVVTGCIHYDADDPKRFATGKQSIFPLYSTVSDHAALSALMTACGYDPD